MKRKVIQWVILFALTMWGGVSFLILAGEENPAKPMSLGMFFLLKLAALLSFALCALVGRWLSHKNLLPDIPEE